VNPSGELRWRVRFRIDRKQLAETFARPEDAQDFARFVNKVGGAEARRVLTQRQNPTSTLTLAEWVDQYLDPNTGILTGIEPGTRRGYRVIADNSFLPILGERPVNMIDRADIGKWVNWQEKQYPRAAYNRDGSLKPGAQPLAEKTIRNYHALLAGIFTAAVDAGLRADNPARKTRITRREQHESVFLTRDEFAAVLANVDDYYKPLVSFLVWSQTRWSEATALKWDRVNLDTIPPTIRVTRAWKKGDTTTPGTVKSRRGNRTIALWLGILRQLGTPGKPDELVFKSRQAHGRIWHGTFRDNVWEPAVRRSGISKHPTIHDLRHSGASWLIADGMPLPEIQARLGHESITTTINTYGHLMPDAHTRLASSLERMSLDMDTKALER
jgi:integrase